MSTFTPAMEKFVPHKIDSEGSFESHLLGDVKAGFPSPAEDIREKLDLIKLLISHSASRVLLAILLRYGASTSEKDIP